MERDDTPPPPLPPRRPAGYRPLAPIMGPRPNQHLAGQRPTAPEIGPRPIRLVEHGIGPRLNQPADQRLVVNQIVPRIPILPTMRPYLNQPSSSRGVITREGHRLMYVTPGMELRQDRRVAGQRPIRPIIVPLAVHPVIIRPIIEPGRMGFVMCNGIIRPIGGPLPLLLEPPILNGTAHLRPVCLTAVERRLMALNSPVIFSAPSLRYFEPFRPIERARILEIGEPEPSTVQGSSSDDSEHDTPMPGSGILEPHTGVNNPIQEPKEPDVDSVEPLSHSTSSEMLTLSSQAASIEDLQKDIVDFEEGEPDPGADEPGSGVVEPGSEADEPGSGAIKPDPVDDELGFVVGEPDSSVDEPDPGTVEPDPGADEAGFWDVEQSPGRGLWG